MLSPKRVKFRKMQRGRMRGVATRGNTIAFGQFALQAQECGWIKAEVVLSIRHSGPEHLGDRSGGAVGHELEHDQSVAVGATPDLIENTAHLRHGASDEASVGLGGGSRGG